jgi:hypothetical protein
LSAPRADRFVTEAAFAQVLGAEQAARASIAAAAQRSTEVAEQARAEARSRDERARRHVAAVLAAFERALQADLARMAAEAAALAVDTPLDARDRVRVEQAVQHLAAHITGDA